MAIAADADVRSATRSAEPSYTERLAEFLVGIRASDLPTELLETADDFMLDWLGCAIAGLPTSPGQALMRHTAQQPAAEVSTLGFSEGRSAQVAAFHNGAVSHITELDDVDRGSVTHPGAVIIPAALAVAERLELGGRDFLAA